LADFIIGEIPTLKNGSILVVTSKIVALSQGRIVDNIKNRREKEEWIKKESDKFYETKWCYLCLKDGHWCANGGIDESNMASGGLILWPEKNYEEAENLRKILTKHYKIKELGILFTDSRIFSSACRSYRSSARLCRIQGAQKLCRRKRYFRQKVQI